MTTHCNCNGNLIPSGNDFYLAIALKSRSLVDGEVVETPFDFEAADTYNARIYGILDGKTLSTMVGLKDGTTDTVIIDAKGVPLIRAIGVEVTGTVDGRAFRAAEKGFLSIVEFNGEARVVFTPVTGGQQANLVMTLTFLPSAAVVGKNAYEIWKEEPGNQDKTLADFIYFLGHGESAYEIAVRYGYTGTEAEYNMLYFDAVDVANTAGQNAQQAADTANEMAAQAQDAAELADAATANANNAATAAAATVDAAIDNMEDTLNAAIAAQDAEIASKEAEIDAEFATQTALINQKQMEIGALPSDLSPTIGSTNWVTSGGIYSSTPSNDNNNNDADLDITDEIGNVLVKFTNGHIRTKKFNSAEVPTRSEVEESNPVSTGNDDTNDFAIKDENDYSIVQFYDGHIQTKNFDSSEVKLKVDYSDEDFSITDESGFQIVTFSDGNIKTKNFDSKEVTIKYVDCLGDSLTMGFTSSGWFEPSLQNTLGGKYTVRNWGVGGEKGSTIMTRLGAAQVVFPQSFVLPADCSPVQIATSSSPMRNSFNGIAFTPLLQGTENDPTLKTRVINPCYVNGIECTMKYLGNDYYAQSPYTLQRNYEGDRDVTISPHTQIFLNTGKQMAHSYISIVWIGENKEISGQFNVDEVVLMNKTIAHYLSNTRYIFIGLHKLTGETAEDYEDKMIKAFGNKFFNLREYACTNMIYDCGMTPTAQDLQDMANGICPSSLLLDYSHFKPKSNEIIGIKLGEMCKELGYLNN